MLDPEVAQDQSILPAPRTLSSDRSHWSLSVFSARPSARKIAQLRVRTDDTECDATGRKFVMEVVQHACAGEVDIG